MRTCNLSDMSDGLMASTCTLSITHKQTFFLETEYETLALAVTGSLIQNGIEWMITPYCLGGI